MSSYPGGHNRSDIKADILDAISRNDADTLKVLFGRHKDELEQYGTGAFFKLACKNNRYQCAKFLVDYVDVSVTSSKKLFRNSCSESSIDIVKLLISHGANPRTDGDISIRWAADGGNLEVLKYLVEQFGLSNSNTPKTADEKNNLEHALRLAAGEGHIEVVRYFDSIGVDIHYDRERALRLAARYGHLNVVEYIASKGADINAANGETVLVASMDNNHEVLSFLIARGAEIHVKDDAPIKLAAASGSRDTLDLLFQQDPEHYSQLFRTDKDLLSVDAAQAYLAEHLLNRNSAPQKKRRAARL